MTMLILYLILKIKHVPALMPHGQYQTIELLFKNFFEGNNGMTLTEDRISFFKIG